MSPDSAAQWAARFERIGLGFPHMTVAEFAEAQCQAHGANTAIEVIETGESLTFSQLWQRVTEAAHGLHKLGVGRGDRVAVQLPNGWHYPAIWLALARLGAVHVPVNTRYTPEEVRFVLNDSGAQVMVALGAEASVVPGVQGVAVAELFQPPQSGAHLPPGPTDPETLLNIQYTSGTTGLPKGCMLSHDYWLVLARSAAAWDAEPARRILSAQPYFYMDPQWITLKALLNGATMVIAPGLSSSRFLGWLIEHRIDWCMFPILMARLPLSGAEPQACLKQVATFGWDPETCRRFHDHYAGLAREGFGMTEIGLGTAMPAAAQQMFDSASTGIAGPCRQTSVRRPDGSEAAPGEEGELWVRGRSIFQGYWNRPDATQQACPGEGWFRTGDLFVKDANGFHWIRGRIKDMIRRSSENIAAREVEAALCSLPGIVEAAALAEPDSLRGEEVLAVLQHADAPPSDMAAFVEGARPALAQRLAVFKRPRYWIFTDHYPRTASNKVQKTQLRQALLGRPAFDSQTASWVTLA